MRFKKKVPVTAGSSLDLAIRHAVSTGKQFMYNHQAVTIEELHGNTKTKYFMIMSCNTEFNVERF